MWTLADPRRTGQAARRLRRPPDRRRLLRVLRENLTMLWQENDVLFLFLDLNQAGDALYDAQIEDFMNEEMKGHQICR